MTTVGVLGAGQLARMLALAAHRLGITVRALDPSDHPCAAPVCPVTQASFTDLPAIDRFLTGLDALTFEFESIPADTIRHAGERLPTHPNAESLRLSQDRVLEKQVFSEVGFEIPRFAPVDSIEDLHTAAAHIGLPAILKSRTGGYDGRSQARIHSLEQLNDAWTAIGTVPAILEELVPFEREISLIGVRSTTGEIDFYPPVENLHINSTLYTSRAPAELSRAHELEAQHHARTMLERLEHVGVLCIELFLTRNGRLLANEFAPRVHNSGHWTIEGAHTSQFENHLRAILGLPLGSTEAIAHSAMINIVGAEPPLAKLLAIESARIHLYTKQPRRGRKLGHVTVTDNDPAHTHALLDRLTAIIPPPPGV
ncbi:MAG: 5-(carboxyamino)imidazole ribonucleotide synthase [Phycisphaeraceae bacterium]|nr:MAG: 5-(carboxyamino)imidazole ribonucleotide synthase [Phycisphaeraceae bacterium]